MNSNKTCSVCERLGGCIAPEACEMCMDEFSYYEAAKPYVRWGTAVLIVLFLAALASPLYLHHFI